MLELKPWSGLSGTESSAQSGRRDPQNLIGCSPESHNVDLEGRAGLHLCWTGVQPDTFRVYIGWCLSKSLPVLTWWWLPQPSPLLFSHGRLLTGWPSVDTWCHLDTTPRLPRHPLFEALVHQRLPEVNPSLTQDSLTSSFHIPGASRNNHHQGLLVGDPVAGTSRPMLFSALHAVLYFIVQIKPILKSINFSYKNLLELEDDNTTVA